MVSEFAGFWKDDENSNLDRKFHKRRCCRIEEAVGENQIVRNLIYQCIFAWLLVYMG